MKNKFFLPTVVLFLTALHLSTIAQGIWTQKGNVPGWSGGGYGLSTATKGYVFGGTNLWEYEPTTDTWTQMANLPSTTRGGVATFTIGQKEYICFGYISGNWSNEVWEFDIGTNSWTQKNNFVGLARIGAVGFSINGKGYAGLGNNTGYLTDFWEYDNTTDTWTQKSNFPGAGRDYANSFCIGLNAYVGLGQGSTVYQDFFEYNSSTDTWTQKATFPILRSYAVGFSIGTLGYICAGQGPVYTFNNDLWEYNPSLDNWSQGLSFGGQGRETPFAFSINSCAFIGGGSQQYFDPPVINFNDVWAFCFPTAADDISKDKIELSISPNPFSSQTVLQTSNLFRNATLTVDNCFGQTVAQIKNINGQAVTFNRNNLASGLYFVRMTEENKTIVADKLVITDN